MDSIQNQLVVFFWRSAKDVVSNLISVSWMPDPNTEPVEMIALQMLYDVANPIVATVTTILF